MYFLEDILVYKRNFVSILTFQTFHELLLNLSIPLFSYFYRALFKAFSHRHFIVEQTLLSVSQAHLHLEARTCLTLPLVLGCLWSFYHSDGILLNIHIWRGRGGGSKQNRNQITCLGMIHLFCPSVKLTL